jgi:prepilin peptidase CpaA
VFGGRTIEVVHVVAVTIALVACVTDLRSQRIPNILTFGGALAGVVFHTASGAADGLFLSVSGWVVGVAVFLLPFVLGGMGAGDVKLVAALGAWLGPMDTLWLGIYTALAGGIAALVLAVARGYLRQALSNIYLLLMHWRITGIRPLREVSLAGSGGPRLAYAVPVLGGLVATLWLR